MALVLVTMFFKHITSSKRNKSKINIWDYIKLKNFVIKEAISRMKGQSTEREKLFSNDISTKRSIPKIYKEPIQLNKKWLEMAEDMKRHFSRKDMPKHEHMKTCSTSLIFKANTDQNHNEMSTYICQNGCYQKDNKYVLRRMWKNGEPGAPSSCTVGGNIDWYSCYRKQFRDSSKNKK